MRSSLIKEVSLPLLSNTDIILKAMFHEQASSDGVNSFAVHLFNILNIRTDRDFVSWLNKSNVRNNSHVSHFLDSVSYLSLDWCTKACLESIVKLTSVV